MSEKTFGEQSYEQFAERYAQLVETKPHNADLAKPAIMALMPNLNGLHILDAGCGSGHYSEYFLDVGASVVAFDVTPKFVEIATERIGTRATVLHHNLAEPLAFAQDNTFDLVFCNLVLDYVADWGAVFREFARVLKPNGIVVMSFGHPLGDWLYVHSKPDVKRHDDGPANYFQTEAFESSWSGFGEPRPVVKAYRRPLEAIINPLLDAGLTLERLTEAQPTDTFREKDPVRYEQFSQEPTFMCIKARASQRGESPA